MSDQRDPLDDFTNDTGAAPSAPPPDKGVVPPGPETPVDADPAKEKENESDPDRNARRGSFTSRVSEKGKTLRTERPRQYTAVLVIGAVVLLGLILIIAIATRDTGRAQTIAPVTKATYDTSPDIDLKFATFMNDVRDDLPEMRKRSEEALKRVTEVEVKFDAISKDIQTSNRMLEVKLEQQFAEMAKNLRSQGGGSAVQTIGGNDLDALIQSLRRQKANSGLSLSEARLRLDHFLKNQGFKGRDLALLRDRGLDQLGFMYVGEVAEEPLDAAELDSLPDNLKAAVKELAEYTKNSAEIRGAVLFREEEMVRWLRTRLGDAIAQKIDPQVMKKAAFLGRVRKENVSEEQEAVLPDLAAQRDRSSIAPDDLFRTEVLVYEQKKRWPTMTPGQHLSLTYALAGMRSTGSGDLSGPVRRAPTNDDLVLLDKTVRDALRLATTQGVRDQGQLLKRGKQAAESRCADLKVVMSQPEIDRMVMNALAEVLRGSGPTAPGLVDLGLGAPQVPQAPQQGPAPAELNLGPLGLREHQAGYFAWLLSSTMVERLKLDPTNPESAAAISAAWTASPSIAKVSWRAVVDRGGDLRAFTTVVVTELQEAMEAGKRVGNIPVSVRGMPPEVAQLLQAVVLGQVAGTTYASDREVQDEALKRALADLHKNGLPRVVAGQVIGTGWPAFALAWSALGYPAPGMSADRVPEVLAVLKKQLSERRVAHEQVSVSGISREFRDKMVRDLNDDLLTSLPAAIVTADDGRMADELLMKLVVANSNRYAVAAIAEALLSAAGVKEVVERFAQLVDRDDMIQPLYAAMAEWIPDQIHGLLEQAKPEVSDSNLSAVGSDAAQRLTPALLQFIAKEVIFQNIEPRLTNAAGTLNKGGLERALGHLRARLQGLNLAPLNNRRIDETTQLLHGEATDVMAGTAQGLRAPSSSTSADGGKTGTGQERPLPSRPPFFDVQDAGLPGVPLGSHKQLMEGARVRNIPRGTSFYCFLETGAVVAVKKNENTTKVQLRATRGFFDPSGQWYTFPPMILQGTLKPNMNGNRIMVEVDHLAFTLPNGRSVSKDIQGIVVDQVDGVGGMLARFERNWSKIAPEALTVGVLQGISAALANETQSVSVQSSGTVIATNSSDAFATGVGEGLNKGVDLATKYAESYMDGISPTLETPNGQPLTAILFSQVDFTELTEADWASMSTLPRKASDGF